jgi:hypothetical protein
MSIVINMLHMIQQGSKYANGEQQICVCLFDPYICVVTVDVDVASMFGRSILAKTFVDCNWWN